MTDNNSQIDTKPGNGNKIYSLVLIWSFITIDQWRATANINGEIGRLSLHVAAFEKLWLSTIENQTAMPSIHCFHTVSQALAWIDDTKSTKPSVLVTGSLYLVGAVLKLLTKNESDLWNKFSINKSVISFFF